MIKVSGGRRSITVWIIVLFPVVLAGCAGPPPRLAPTSPLRVSTENGRSVEWFDLNGNNAADFGQEFSEDGRLVRLLYPAAADKPAEVIDLASIPPEQQQHLVLALDSIRYDMVEEMWQAGRFRYCAPPAALISPFPVMTDLSLSEFFGTSPAPGVEAAYFDGRRLTSGYDIYAKGENTLWEAYVDYLLRPVAHAPAYLKPYPWLNHELRRVQDVYLARSAPMTVGYAVGTSAVGARLGRSGHEAALVDLDRMCRWLLYQTRGRARFTLLSDHGHSFYTSRRIPLADLLGKMGYRVNDRLNRLHDIVVPEFGMVSCAAIHTRLPAEVARDVLRIEGVELSAHASGPDEVIVLSRDGRARITHSNGRFRYETQQGDPLQLKPVFERLASHGQLDDAGFVADGPLFEATAMAVYPDAVYRLWRAFNGLVQNTPDVLVSIEEGYHAGSATMSSMVKLIGVHGNLRQASSFGFVMTSAGELPPVIRMQDLRAALRALGVDVPGRDEAPAPLLEVARSEK